MTANASLPPGRTPPSGRIEASGGVHVLPIRVYYEDTDALGIVYYVNYLKFAERARTEMLRLLGHDQHDLLTRSGLGFTVRRCEVDYYMPARLDDALEVRSTLIELRGASMDLLQTIRREPDILARLRFKIACVDRTGRAQRVPGEIRKLFAPLERREKEGSK